MTHTDLPIELRLAACDLVKTRFSGRAELRRAASLCEVDLARLECRLGLATPADVERAIEARMVERLRARAWEEIEEADRTRGEEKAEALELAYWACELADRPAQRDRIAIRLWGPDDKTSLADLAELAAPEAVRQARALRWERVRTRMSEDPIGRRKPGHMLVQHALRVADRVIGAAGFRTAKHSHDENMEECSPGEERADSRSDSIFSNEAGMSKAYCRKAFRVATSEHFWKISTEILRPEVRARNEAAPRGVVYLSPTIRVRQGRGTSLVCERLS